VENLGCRDPKVPQYYVVRTFPISLQLQGIWYKYSTGSSIAARNMNSRVKRLVTFSVILQYLAAQYADTSNDNLLNYIL